ncbi:protein shuttle craft [Uranotaenia lowii]|uniref:protein shuttle craft n=1 Tax=Uranotaenia lowii TaxID=190385 RepID=UPI00247A34B4|nr:protein shuttle craft [Uranotaenia lowii]
MASNSSQDRPNGSSNGDHQSFEQFISQFSARATVNAGTSSGWSNGDVHSERNGTAGSSSNLKPTAAEFVPRFHRAEGEEANNEARSERPGSGAVRKQHSNGPRWGKNSRRNNRNGNQSDFMRNNNDHQFNSFRNGNNGEGRYSEDNNNYFRDRDEERRPQQQHERRPQQQQYGNGAKRNNWNKPDRRRPPPPGQNRGRYSPQNDDRRMPESNNGDAQNHNNEKSNPPKERKPNNSYNKNRNRARQEKLEAKIISKCSQREKLIRELDSSKLECLVCCDLVRPTQSIWSCPNCYHILHLNCTIKWANSSQSEEGWRCPACQNVSQKIPREYFCFCGKLKNPQYNRNDVAHSCGELCGREELCIHACTLLCHPGPCPPCQALVQRMCGCGRSSKPLQCSQKEEIFCEATCAKPLNCGIHSCELKCHGGECGKCNQTLEHQCHCGKENKQVACTVENLNNTQFSCGKPCDNELDCKNHRCSKICHPAPCEGCVLSPEIITSCPCGKQAVVKGERTSCLDPIPVCKGTCGKQLPCGNPGSRHVCNGKCHTGECPPCNKTTVVKCRCGHMDQQMKCKNLQTRADDARCKKRCTRMRSCAKHRCNQECCIDYDHICPKNCSHMLSCGRHRCDKPCHKGSCHTCHRVSFDELTCECGASVIYPPVPCGTKKPPCDKPCSRQHVCAHQVLHNCHSEAECPPCVVLTSQYCYGKHEQRKTIPCYQDSFSCGLHCGKPLSCGRHKCIKPCHKDAECLAADETCRQSCTTTRTTCPHQCKAPCHDGECPTDLPCREVVEVTCECGNRKQNRTCHDYSKDYRRIVSAQLASSMQEMQRGGSVELSDILGTGKPKTTKTLECNDECRTLERNRRLAIGLQIRNPDLASATKFQPNYSAFLKQYARKDMNLIKTVHDKLTELVKLAKESKQKSRSFSFPVMNREKRQVVHEMCGMFGVESVAYDAEPNRNVVATADRFTSWLPSMSLMEVIQRENGQRRVIVPNLNAWGRTAAGSTTK